jgi:hypothetical protein
MLKYFTKQLQKLSKIQQAILAFAIGYFIYSSYIQVENFFNENEDVEDESIKTGYFDAVAQNLGLETSNTLEQDRQDKAKADNYMAYDKSYGCKCKDNENAKKAFAIADDYKKY